MNKIKTILMGTADFAAEIFKKAYPKLKNNSDIIAVITAPDKPVSRKQILSPSPVKKWAIENNLKILQPEKIREPEWIKKNQELNPELIILCAYGQIIPKEILDIPRLKALNIHPSLLPKHRGASPIQAAILNGDKETGITLMIMDEKMDHGPILAYSKLLIINKKITYQELEKKLIKASSNLLIKTLPDWINGKIKPQVQDHSKASFCKLIKKENGKIDWNESAERIERQVRAYQKWPGSYTFWNDKQLKIIEADILNKKTNHKIGEVFLDENKPARHCKQSIAGENLYVQAGKGSLILKQIQLEGKKTMTAKEFLNGYKEIIGSIFQ